MPTPTPGGIKFFEHKQGSPAVTWNIFHGFGSRPLVDTLVLDGGVAKKAFPLSVVHVDNNNVRIVWSTARAGSASLASTVS